MSDQAKARLEEERKNWRKDHPFGFFAKPTVTPDGNLNLMKWEFGIPGKKNTPWQIGVYTGELTFSNDYPINPPTVKFVPTIFHPNVHVSGVANANALFEDCHQPTFTITDVLFRIQTFLSEPNPRHSADITASIFYNDHRDSYNKLVLRKARSSHLEFWGGKYCF